ncbi:beta-lysine acetyltransferase [Desulfonatronum thiosulfatophilum]|uniref:Beta-lysine acetyltransferase n=1 Tax=Desulfonatronum thiosulfatophilum TaxID=617002 RepID=A0A1G6EQA5_9BACT|nr:putative beta-lysine N-acetyltransferase [Desulfonatronum thiosulfatophilum]SDB59607.1 beta-lysine acetyltransferase [Desulfonatronum thiosulfatophilum]
MSLSPSAAHAADSLEHIGNSLVQHGPLNERAYLMHLAPREETTVLSRLETLARENGYTKIFAKVPENVASRFTRAGYVAEAHVPGLFNGREGGVFMGRYFADWRKHPCNLDELRTVLAVSRKKAGLSTQLTPPPLPDNAHIVRMHPYQADAMAALYRNVFDSYPFPVFDPDYLRQAMAGDVQYYGILIQGRLAALASAEMDLEIGAAEMTDFATLTEYRGRKLAGILLKHMEDRMRAEGLATLYTIARAGSYGMNITFARAGYAFGGTLPNNTHIAGGLESMNVWHLALDQRQLSN